MEERMQKVRGSQTHLFQAEMQITYQEMQKGCGEKEAYERFGQRIGMPEYRRLSSLLARNLEKGTRNLCDLLSAESQEAWENRKFQAKKLGEEAGMKLLFPMLLLFVLILIILLDVYKRQGDSRGSKQTARSVCHCRNSGTRGCEERWHP